MSGGITRRRLTEERNAWLKNHPLGFAVKLESRPDGSVNLVVWQGWNYSVEDVLSDHVELCHQLLILQTDWECGYYPLTLDFSEDYPSKPPKCKFPQGFFHPNVFPSRTGWRPAITVKQILVGIQDLLDQPNPADPAQIEGCRFLIQKPTEYRRRVRLQTPSNIRLLCSMVNSMLFYWKVLMTNERKRKRIYALLKGADLLTG